MSIVLVCRANLCRSPTAEVMLHVALDAVGVDAEVSSAGIEAVPRQVTPPVFAELALERGIDLRDRTPVLFQPSVAQRSDLVLTMTRDLLRTLVVATPAVWPKAFTLLEVVRRGTSLEPPEPHDSLASWCGRLHATRDRAELLGSNPIDDIRDPMAPDATEDSVEMFEQLERATRRLAAMLAVLSG